MSCFTVIGYFFLPFLWLMKLEYTNVSISKEELILNLGSIESETNTLLGAMKNEEFQICIFIISGLLLLVSFILTRFHPRKIGLFLIIFSILRFDEFLRLQAQIQYSSHGAGSAFMFLGKAIEYNLIINPVYLILIFSIHICLFLEGLILVSIPLSKFRKEIVLSFTSEKYTIKIKEEFISRATSILPFFCIYTISFLGMFGAANLLLSVLINTGSLIGLYLVHIIIAAGLFIVFIVIMKRIREPIINLSKTRRILEYISFSSFFLLTTFLTTFFWAEQLNSSSMTLNFILEKIFKLTGAVPEKILQISFFHYLLIFLIPFILALISYYFFYVRKMKKTEDTEEKEFIENSFRLTKPKKSHISTLIFLFLILGLPINCICQGSNIFPVLTLTNFDGSDAFGLNWGSSKKIQFEDFVFYSNSSFEINIMFEYNYHNIPEFLRQDFIWVDRMIVDSNNDSLFDTDWNFDFIEIKPSSSTMEYMVSNNTEGYNFALYNSGSFQIRGIFNGTVFIGSTFNLLLVFYEKSSKNRFLVLSDIIYVEIFI